MIEERKEFLLKHKLISFRKDFIVLSPHFTNCHWKKFDQKELIENIKGDSITEKIYRYLYNYNEDVYCIWCVKKKVKFKTITDGFADFCSKRCVEEYVKARGNFTTLGWKHTKESKQKMKDGHADFTGDNNPFKKAIERDPTIRKRCSQNKKNWWKSLSDERRKEISKIFSIAQANNVNFSTIHRNHRCGCFISKKMKRNFFFRSSWELFVCEFLEDCDGVIEYCLEKFCIPYIKDKKQRNTRIDFWIKTNNNEMIIEVKPEGFIPSAINRIQAMQQYCIDNSMNFFVVSKNRLNEESLCGIIKGEIQNENFKRFE